MDFLNRQRMDYHRTLPWLRFPLSTGGKTQNLKPKSTDHYINTTNVDSNDACVGVVSCDWHLRMMSLNNNIAFLNIT